MQNKNTNIELKYIDLRTPQRHSCPAIAVPVEDDSIGDFMNDKSKENIEPEPPVQTLSQAIKTNAAKESRNPSSQVKALRKVKSMQPDANNLSGRQMNDKTIESSEEDGQSLRRMPKRDEERQEEPLPVLLSDFKGPPLPKRIWSWLFCLTLALYYTAVLVIMIKLLVFQFQDNPFPLDSTSGAILYIAENYRYDPIMNVQLTTSECPAGFSEAKLTTWPGTRDGCYSIGDDSLESELCNDIDTLKEESVYSISQQDLYNWKGYTWCIQRANKELDYVFAESCPDGFRNCANGYCFNESIDCPITEITLTDQQTNSSITDKSKLLTIKREEGQLPIVSINASINGLPCFSLNEDPPSDSPYILLKTRKNGCLSFGVDQSSFEIDRDIQEDFLIDNNPVSSILSLPGYQSILESTPAVLVGRRKLNITVNEFCTNLKIDVLEKASNGIQTFNTAYISTVTSVVILHIIIGLVLVGFFSSGIRKRSLGLILWKGGLCYRIFFLTFFALEMAALAALTVYVVIYKAKLNNADLYFNQVISSDCFGQSQAGNVITNFSKFKSDTVDMIFVYSLVATGIALAFLVILGRAICYSRKPSPSV